MKLPALAIAATLIASPVYAENITIGCHLVNKYSAFQVNIFLDQARQAIGPQEVGKFHHIYIGLKHLCIADSKASSVVHISVALRELLAQNGVHIKIAKK
jgi:hypothetical protein